MFKGNAQHDSCEVLGTIIRMLQEDMNEVQEQQRFQIDSSLRNNEAFS